MAWREWLTLPRGVVGWPTYRPPMTHPASTMVLQKIPSADASDIETKRHFLPTNSSSSTPHDSSSMSYGGFTWYAWRILYQRE
jgi:hypothetical protein